MNPLILGLGALALGLATHAMAFTDSNAEMQVLSQDQALAGPARAPAVQALWVPPSAKSLDGFRPPLPQPNLTRPAEVRPASTPTTTPSRPRPRIWMTRLR
jgi:hypothetical protein